MFGTRRSAIAAALAATIGAAERSGADSVQSGQLSTAGSYEPAEQRHVIIKGVPVYYESRGLGQPVVMIHGFTLDHRSLVGCMEPVFSGRVGWRRIYFDLPGMGRTPASSGAIASSDDMLDIVLGFIDAVIPGKRFSLVGQSYGGYLARGVLARKAASIDGMALICPVVVAERAKRDLPQHSVVAKDEVFLASLSEAEREAFTSNFVVQNRMTWQRFREELLPAIRSADQPVLESVARRYALSFDPDAHSQPFPGPVMILSGRQDSDVGYRDQWKLSEKFSRVTFAMLDRAGHGLAIEQAGLFTRLVQEWLDRVAEGAG